MERYLCIHGHFYQPPRENPGLDAVEVQDSAYPFHDWNERVTAECYAPNTLARVLDGKGKILKIINNYSKISFNFGPTILNWIERHRADVYEGILEADRISVKERHGHGNAIAQVYNHIIMPLASRRDKETQVIWGIKDFEYRFGRAPEGMWLSETAVDNETLEVLAENGIRFTILSPYQAHRIRPVGANDWIDVTGAKIDPTRVYRCVLKNGKSIDLFFYDGPISFSIAFDDSLTNGENFVRKIIGGFSSQRNWAELVSVATDGESYGHHRKFGEMTLAYVLEKIQRESQIRLTNFGEYLELHPPQWEVEIYENTAWSCAHGVRRWKEDCGCRLNQSSGWNQKWRKPLREGLDWLKGNLDQTFEKEMEGLLYDPRKARNDYIELLLTPSEGFHQGGRQRQNIEDFFSRNGVRPLSLDEKKQALSLLESQRQGLLMYTSCGWFFDDVSGLESTQILHYADRAIQLVETLGKDFESGFLEHLDKAKSNLAYWGTAKNIYLKAVKPSRVSYERLLADWAMSDLFEDNPRQGSFHCYEYDCFDCQRETYDGSSLSTGRVRVVSALTLETEELCFMLLHSGGPNFICVTKAGADWPKVESIKKELFEKFRKGLLDESLALLVKVEGRSWTLKDLFLDERRKILNVVTAENSDHLEKTLRNFYESNKTVVQHLLEEEVALPKAFTLALEYLWERDLARAIQKFNLEESSQEIRQMLDEASYWGINIDLAPLRSAVESELKKKFDEGAYERCLEYLKFSRQLGLNISLWEVQNSFFSLLEEKKGEPLPEILQQVAQQLDFHPTFFEALTRV